MEDEKKKLTLDSLLRRKEVVSALYQRRLLKSVTSSAQRPLTRETGASSANSTLRESILSDTSDVIEDSDFESSAKHAKKQQKDLDSSSSNSEDTINTSMISLPLTHPYFGDPATPIKKPVKNKINILSNKIIENVYEKRQNEKLLLSSSPIPANVINYPDINITFSTSKANSSVTTFDTDLNILNSVSNIAEVVNPDTLPVYIDKLPDAMTPSTYNFKTSDLGLEKPVCVPDTEMNTVFFSKNNSHVISSSLSIPVDVVVDHNITINSIDSAITADPCMSGQFDEHVVMNSPSPRAVCQVSPSLLNKEHVADFELLAINDVDTDYNNKTKNKVDSAANSVLPVLDEEDNGINPKTPSIDNNDDVDLILSAQKDVHSDLNSKTPYINSNTAAVSSSTSDVVIKSVKAKKRPARAVKKKFLDFMSDEDADDYSAGSSDNWSVENDYGSSESETSPVAKKVKKHKNTEKHEENLKKKNIKKINMRKVGKKSKEGGKGYETRTGKCIPERKMQSNPCLPNKCKRGCYNVTEKRRTSLFHFYWNLEPQRRKDWLARNSNIVNCARKRTDSLISRRNVTFDYYVNNGEGHQKVCQKFLLSTLDISQKFLLYTLNNCKDEVALKDQRKCNNTNKYSESTKATVREFIEKLPAVPSHYNRRKTSKVYLPQELKNISNIYRLYVKECRSSNVQYVGESTFRGIFQNEYNLSFHTPKKDKCIICVKAEHNECLDANQKDSLQEHLNEKKATYKRFEQHQHLPLTKKDTAVCTFDLQKILNTPYGDSVILYYTRKYPIFNFTVYESITQEVFCYLWGECDAKRGANEIATLLYSYLKSVDDKGIKNLLMYCDACPGQNKNKTILTVLNYFLIKSTHLEVIQINYLLPGHTYMPVDSVHATIEREVKKLTVWSPTQWPSYIEAARKNPKPYNVNVMEYSDFLNWDEITAETFTNETCKGLKIRNLRIVTLKKKHPTEIYIKYSMKDDTPTVKVTLFQKSTKKGKGKGKGKSRSRLVLSAKAMSELGHEKVLTMSPTKLYTNKLPISDVKYRDLKRLCDNGVIPKRYHNDFLQLPKGTDVPDTLTLTDEEDEEEQTD